MLRWDDESYVYLMAAIFGMSVGIALMAAIIVEVTGRMVLLIPDAVKKIREQASKQGREEGREAGREEQNARLDEAYRRFGVIVDGVPALPRTPEVDEFMSGNHPKK